MPDRDRTAEVTQTVPGDTHRARPRHLRPFSDEYYRRIRARISDTSTRVCERIETPAGYLVDVRAGELLTIRLTDGPQIVNMFPFNSADPDERLWAHQTCLIEGLFLSRWSRLWGTMARLRPLMTIVEDTVTTRPTPEAPAAKHHPILGGAEVPALWRYEGGSPEVLSSWEQFGAALAPRGLGPELLMDDLCLFQKSAMADCWMRTLPSDALRGDRVVFFAEIDVTVLLALSPHVEGGLPAREVGSKPRVIEVSVSGFLEEPLPWPYPDMQYPDLSLYLDARGVRSREVAPTAIGAS